ncbi:Phenylserine dehydratase [Aquimixticola soesokkakensis]|uniref:Phenylserine dehydratase n=1 Tax=Aquimixticola soesokkakensis TaxID=1519096 RepID=A0A1Y5TB19_9RHOB|nr:threonine/serine dehydratase [Aquimixticola soesokkakensis]SLN59684.1 Phenylserine dehydratase [Aquimixticola soesokkakensis]
MTTITAILAAAERAKGHVRRTPLLSSPFLDEIAGKRVLIKAECLQHTGSFKFRGAWAALTALDPERRAGGVLAFSSGNHAQGVALAARMHGVPAVIVMPADAPQVKLANTRALGAEVVTYDRVTQDREAIGQALATARNLTLVKPYDAEMTIAGQGTCGLEIAQQAQEIGVDRAAVLVPCGGGGLTSGIAVALAALAPDMQVMPVEPQGFDDVARSLATGSPQRNASLSGSICDAIVTPTPGVLTFPLMQRHCARGLVVSDAQALQAVARAFERLRIVVEPGGAVALAAALTQARDIAADTVIAVASGGNIDAATMAQALAMQN